MFFGKPIIAFDCVYNRESTENKAIYFDSSETLIKLLTAQILDPIVIGQEMKRIANRRYRWEIIAQQYERLLIQIGRVIGATSGYIEKYSV